MKFLISILLAFAMGFNHLSAQCSVPVEGIFGGTTATVGDTNYYATHLFDGPNTMVGGYMQVFGGTVVDQKLFNLSEGVFPWTAYVFAVVWNTPGQGSLLYEAYQSFGGTYCTELRTHVVNVLSGPLLDGEIIGPEVVCNFDTATYSTPAIPNGAYNWIVQGGLLISGNGTPQIEVAWDENNYRDAAGYVILDITNGSSGTSKIHPVSTSGWSTAPTQVLYGPENPPNCSSSPSKYYASMQMDSYAWSTQGGTIVSGQGTDTVNVQWNGMGSGSIEVVGTPPSNPFGCSVSPLRHSLSVNLPLSSQIYPQVLSSPNALINSTVSYATLLNAGHTYNWTVTGGTIVSGQGTNQVMVQWTSGGPQTLTITETGPSCGPGTQNIPVNVTGFNVNISATDSTTYSYTGSANCTQLTANTTPVPPNPTYSWSTGDVTPSIAVCPTTTTTYSVTVSDASMGAQTSSFTVTVLPAPTCNGGTGIQMCRSFGQFTFTQCVPPFSVNTYLAQGATLGPCPNKSDQDAVFPEGPVLQLHPNPWSAQSKLTILLEETQAISLKLTDVQGKQIRNVFQGNVQSGELFELVLDRQGLPAGLYFIQMETERQGMITQKMILR